MFFYDFRNGLANAIVLETVIKNGLDIHLLRKNLTRFGGFLYFARRICLRQHKLALKNQLFKNRILKRIGSRIQFCMTFQVYAGTKKSTVHGIFKDEVGSSIFSGHFWATVEARLGSGYLYFIVLQVHLCN